MSAIAYYEGTAQKSEQWDDAAQTYTAWAPDGTVKTTRAYTAAEVQAAQQSVTSVAALNNQSSLQQKAQAALNANATFQAIASPTNAQNAAQVQALTKQSNGIIRLLLNALDSTTGT